MPVSSSETTKRRISVDLSQEMLDWLDGLKSEFGLRSRGAILERLLSELRKQDDDEGIDGLLDDEHDDLIACDVAGEGAGASTPVQGPGDAAGAHDQSHQAATLDETTAIVLIPGSSELVQALDQVCDQDRISDSGSSVLGDGLRAEARPPVSRGRARPAAVSGGSSADGIQLPGFVRRQAQQLRRSLQAEPQPINDRSLILISTADLEDALHRAERHWQEIYGQPAGEAVLEAAMVWLARDIWPQSDSCEGRPFTWSLIQQVVSSVAPGWRLGDPSLARVIAAAGVLEDPFSGATLSLRVPTLITRFVQRQRSRQKRTTSFDAIDQAMTVHAALRLLQLPTVADRPYCLQDIREAYRQQAQNHHPDAGGSTDAMRRLNEAYQFLKERYRRSA